MKGVANAPPPQENRPLLGLEVYSSDSESESGSSPDGKSHRGDDEAKSSRSSKSKPLVPKIPKPEEIAAAFSGGGGGEGFIPVPRSMQQRQRTTSGSSSKEKEREHKKEKKRKEKVKDHTDSGHESGSGRDKEHKRDRKKSSDKTTMLAWRLRERKTRLLRRHAVRTTRRTRRGGGRRSEERNAIAESRSTPPSPVNLVAVVVESARPHRCPHSPAVVITLLPPVLSSPK
jgi:hypothetical protein